MARKQQIILTHGSGTPTYDKSSFAKGEVLVRHAPEDKDARLYSPNNNESDWIEFPSKAYVDVTVTEVKNTITGTTGINTQITELSNRLGTGVTTANTVTAQLKAVNDKIDGLNNTYVTDSELSVAVSTLEGKITKAKTTLTTGETGGIKVTQSTTEPNNYIVEGVGLATTAVTNELDTRLDTAEGKLTTIQGNGDGSIAKAQADAIASAKTYTNTELSNYLGSGVTTASTVTKQLKDVTDAIETIQGDDETLSIREIAANEVAKIVANAPENFDTLKEIADWITSDTTGAAGISNDITELKGIVTGFNSTDTIKKTTDALDERLASAETKLDVINGTSGTTGSIAKAQADAIASAKTYTNTELSNHLGTGVTTANTVTKQLKDITDTYITAATITNSSVNKITATAANNVITFNFDNMVIDGGEY